MKEIRINAFDMFCVSHQSTGLWRHPRDVSMSKFSLKYWLDLAKTLERGKIDGLFLADVLGPYDVYAGNANAALRNGAQTPNGDPMLLIPAMASVTNNLCFGVTGNLAYESPYLLARRMTTLDHLTEGRIGWNVVMGYLQSAAKGFGLKQQPEHDTRYEIAEEYMSVVYRFWEESWERGAVVRDLQNAVYADPAKIHRVEHEGEYFRVDAIHLSEPSPQRTPVIYQAGASSRGRAFASKHAECIFVGGPSKRVIAPQVADIRRRAKEFGRNPADIRIYTMVSPIVGRTDAEAQEMYAEYRRYANLEGAFALMSGWSGIDFSQYDLDQEVQQIRNDAIHSVVDAFTVDDPSRVWTVREIAEYVAVGGYGPVIVGSPQTVADELQSWVNETDVDGFNLSYTVVPETFTNFVDMVVPELQRRGIFKQEYDSHKTYREKLFHKGPFIQPSHPAAQYRFDSKGPNQGSDAGRSVNNIEAVDAKPRKSRAQEAATR